MRDPEFLDELFSKTPEFSSFNSYSSVKSQVSFRKFSFSGNH